MNTPLSSIQNQVAPNVIDLGLGDPPLSLLPLELVRDAAQARLSQDDNSFLQYGAEQGDGNFRFVLANFLTKGYGFKVNPEDLFRSEEHTSELQSQSNLVCRLLLEKKNKK